MLLKPEDRALFKKSSLLLPADKRIGDKRVGEKEIEKVEKHQDLKREIARMWNMRAVQVVPIVVGSLGNVTKNLEKWLGKLNIKISISLLQKTTLLGTARTLGTVFEL